MSPPHGELLSICVFCGAANGSQPVYMQAARDLGRALALGRARLVYGGGGVGLMGELARTCRDAGGAVSGVIPDHLMRREVGLHGLAELLVVPDMHTRKRVMFDRSDAFVVLPGGLGTLDETYEILTWRQLGLHDKPIVLVNIAGYWDAFIALFESMQANGFVHARDRGLFTVVAGVEEVLPTVAAAVGAPRRRSQPNLF